MAEDERSPQLKAVLDRAVKRERDAIKTHDTAARKHDSANTFIEQVALSETDEVLRQRAQKRAADSRSRAAAARDWAATAAGQRLRDEGVDLDSA